VRADTRRCPVALVPRLWWLAIPALIFMVLFCIVPVASLLALSFNKATPGVIGQQPHFTLAIFERIFTRSLYYSAIWRSVGIRVTVVACCLVPGYPVAHAIARARKIAMATFLTFPPQGLSLRWIRSFFVSDTFRPAFSRSFRLAAVSTVISTVPGTMAAVFLTRASGWHAQRLRGSSS